MTDDMKLIDCNGYKHDMTKRQVRIMYTLGFTAFILSWIMNLCYYKVHPSAVDFRPKTFKEKCFIYVLGKKKQIPIPCMTNEGIQKESTIVKRRKISKVDIVYLQLSADYIDYIHCTLQVASFEDTMV